MQEKVKSKQNMNMVVLKDDWYCMNMRDIFRRYGEGMIVFSIFFAVLSIFMKNKGVELNMYILLLSSTGVVSYIYILSAAMIRSNLAVMLLRSCSGYDRVKKTAKCAQRNLYICACVNFVVIFAISILYYRGIDVICIGLLCLTALIINCIIIVFAYDDQEVIVDSPVIDGKTRVIIKLKTGERIKYQGDFDLSVDGSDLIIMRQDSCYKTYAAKDIKALVIKNSKKQKMCV